MKRTVFILAALCLVFVAVFAAGRIYDEYDYRLWSYEYSPVLTTETTEDLNNPYIGWYEIYGYSIGEDYYLGTELGSHISISSPDCELVLIEINLANYADGDISEHGMQEIEMLISGWAATGRQLMVRFLYDFKGLAYETEPSEITIIERHMDQVADVLNAHADSVYMTQGIFVGNVGEMHSSAYMTTEGMRQLGQHYASVLTPSILMSVRTPEHYRIICERDTPVTAEEAYSDDIAARIGLFNDGMLASGNDLGTYGDGPISDLSEAHEGKGTREEEIAFQNELCRYVVNGGEVVVDNVYNDFGNAVSDLRDMHISYLGLYHDADVKEKWQNSLYNASDYFGDDIYDGFNGYDYISRHIGYRFVLKSSDSSQMNFWNRNLSISFDVENIGFSNCYRDAAVTLFMTDIKNNETLAVPVDTDIRSWDSDKGVYTVNVEIPIDSLNGAEYEVAIGLQDDMTGKTIAFSNGDNKSSRVGGAYVIGSLALTKTEPWK